MSSGADHGPGRYEIRLKGHLDPRWASWFDDMSVSHDADGTTVIRGLRRRPVGPARPAAQGPRHRTAPRLGRPRRGGPATSTHTPKGTTMNRFTRRIAMTSARHPWRTIASWVLVLGGLFFLAGAVGRHLHRGLLGAGQPERPRCGPAGRELPRGGQGHGPGRLRRRGRRDARGAQRGHRRGARRRLHRRARRVGGRPVRGRHHLGGRPDRLRAAHAGRPGARDRQARDDGALRGRRPGSRSRACRSSSAAKPSSTRPRTTPATPGSGSSSPSSSWSSCSAPS